jgi:hypothetical protein
MDAKITKFQKGTNVGTRFCQHCKRVVWASRYERGCDCCKECYDYFGAENSVSDGLMTQEEFDAEFPNGSPAEQAEKAREEVKIALKRANDAAFVALAKDAMKMMAEARAKRAAASEVEECWTAWMRNVG